MDLAKYKWKNHVGNSRQKGALPLTYEQYLSKLDEAGITADQVGQKRHHYHLARYTDKGDYTPTSCRFIPHLENLAEQKTNGGTESMRLKKKGRNKFNDESIARYCQTVAGRNSETHPYMIVRAKKAAETMRGRSKHNHPGVARTAIKKAQPYAFYDPNGYLHTGSNMEEFAKEHGLLGNALSKLKHGRLKTYHGWRWAYCAMNDVRTTG